MKENHRKIKELSLVYELSLAIGLSLNPRKNCLSFLSALKEGIGLHLAAVWVEGWLVDKPGHDLLFFEGVPADAGNNPTLAREIREHGTGKAMIRQDGRLAFLPLLDFGQLVMCCRSGGVQPFSIHDVESLHPVIEKFALSLRGAFAHHQLLQAERRISTNEHKLRQIINTSLDAAILVDAKGKVLEWSDRARQIYGYEAREVVGKTLYNFIMPPEDHEEQRQILHDFIATGRLAYEEYQPIEGMGYDKQGRRFPVEWNFSLIRVDGTRQICFFARDVSDRKQAETELLRAKQAAEEAKLAERQFLTNMSHEIRTPMNAVIGMTHLLSETKLSETQREYLEALRFSADNLLGIINNVLDLSKIEAGELQFEQHNFNLTELLRSLHQSFQLKVKDKPVRVCLEIDPRIENDVVGDSTRLTQILTNLLGNASKFTNRGTIGLTARLLEQKEEQYLIEFTVSDTGIGIEAEKMGLIFENFKQADRDVTRKYGGTGLGLPIVRQLVEQQGGTIEVNSQVGKGTTFRLILPLGDSKQRLRPASKEKDTANTSTKSDLSDIAVLIVEDNLLNQKLIRQILDRWRIAYELAANGREALEKTTRRLFDIILMDLHMPEIDGLEATRLIRCDQSNPNQQVPIIGITAAALLEEKKQAFEAGMNDFLTKPFSPDVLKSLILKWTEGPKSNRNKRATSTTEIATLPLEKRFTYLYNFSGGDKAFILDMIRTFVEETPTVLDQLTEAVIDENLLLVQQLTHRLQPSYQMMGLEQQQQLAAVLEQMAKAGKDDFEKIKEFVQRLQTVTLESFSELINYKSSIAHEIDKN